MNELTKSVIFGGVALVLVGVVFGISRSAKSDVDTDDLAGQLLFPEFTSEADAASLKITKFDEELATMNRFEVSKDASGRWVIPSNDNYPANADDQMKKASTELIDRKIVDVQDDSSKFHAKYGVLEPSEDVKVGDEGVGIMIEVGDNDGKAIAGIIIGKEVAGDPSKRFVRKKGQDLIYVAEIDPKQFSTKFEDWIDKDILDLNGFDTRSLAIRDYKTRIGATLTSRGIQEQLTLNLKVDMDIRYDSTESKWKLQNMTDYEKNQPVPSFLLTNEELDSTKLNEIRTTLDNLEIVNVRRKPEGLGRDLEVSKDFLNDQTSITSLQEKGFIPAIDPTKGNEVQLFSAAGELHCGTKDGVKYILRFGNPVSSSSSSDVNRFLFVTAALAKELIPEPTYEKEPEVPAAPAGPSAPGDDAKGDEKKEDGEKKKDEKEEGEKKDDAQDDAKLKREAAEKELERVRKENKRKKDEYEEKLKKAQQRVDELNYRFANWYYVISGDTYAKLALGRFQLIKETKSDADVDSFRKFQEQGIEGKDEPPAGPGPGGLPGGMPGGLPPQLRGLQPPR